MGFRKTLSLKQKRRLEMSLTCCPANVDNEFGGYENKRGGSKVSREGVEGAIASYANGMGLHLAFSLLPL